MRSRQPADQRPDPYYSRTAGTLARSPSERLEPTRPPPRPRRGRLDREPRRSRPFLNFLNGLFSLFLLLMLAVGGVGYLLDRQIDAPGPLEKSKVIVIPKGAGAHEIADRLEREGMVLDQRMFTAGYRWLQLAAWFSGSKPVQLRAGDFEIKQSASVREIVDILAEGRTITYKVTIPEGLTSHQIVERLKADPNLSGDIPVIPPEGSLLPETFILQRGASRQAVIDSMVAEQKKLIDRVWAQRKKDLPLRSAEDALVLASIVEKETGRNDERGRVAAVFVNRLKQNMRLQSDPTILYGLFGGKAAWGRAIQRSEIGQKTSHNTYQIDGLPPTPICNPGRAAIEATLNPTETKDLYFVADGAGGHIFAETLKDHNANVSKWRAVERDLKAKAAPVPAPGDTPSMPTPAAGEAPAAEAPNGAPYGVNAPKTRAVVRTAPTKAKPAESSANKSKDTKAGKGAKGKDTKGKTKPKDADDSGDAGSQASTPATPAPEVLPWANPKTKR